MSVQQKKKRKAKTETPRVFLTLLIGSLMVAMHPVHGAISDVTPLLSEHLQGQLVAETSAALSYFISGTSSPQYAVGLTSPLVPVTLQAVDVNGNPQSTGGNKFILRLDRQCTFGSDETPSCINDTSEGRQAAFYEMTDNSDGTYTASYSVPDLTNFALSAELISGDGLEAEHLDYLDLVGDPIYQTVKENIPSMKEAQEGGNAPYTQTAAFVREWGTLVPPYSETYAIEVSHDGAYALYIDGVLQTDSWSFEGPQTTAVSIYLEAGRLYDIRQEILNKNGTAHFDIYWSSPNLEKQKIPLSTVLRSERVGGPDGVFNIEVRDPSIPSMSTIEAFPNVTWVGTPFTVSIQSRNMDGLAVSESTDNITVHMAIQEGLQVYTAAAVHQSNGLYEATLTAEMPGVYTLTVTMTNEYQTRAGLRTVLTKSLEKVFVNGVGTSKREEHVRELQDDDSDDDIRGRARHLVTSNPTSLTYSTISGLTGAREGMPQTVTVVAYDNNNNRKTVGGETFYIRIEQLCTISSATDPTCDLSASQDNVPGLPIDTTMTDNNDGSYSYTYTINGFGTATVTISVLTEGGVYAEYWQNTALSGNPYATYYESNIDHGWGGGTVYPANAADHVSGRWTGYIVPPTSESYTFAVLHDDQFTLNIGDFSMAHYGCCDWDYGTVYLNAWQAYPLTMTWAEGGGGAYIHLYWLRPSASSNVAVPPSAFWLKQRVGNNVHEIEIAPSPVPNKCTIHTYTNNALVGTTHTIQLQSRNSAGTAIASSTDTYTVTMTRNGGSETYTATASHQSNGLYSATLTPLVPGTYTLTATMTNDYQARYSLSTTLSNSPQTVTVADKPTSLTHSTISGLTGAFQGLPHTITVTAYDSDGNRKTYGGESFTLRIENECTISSAQDTTCDLAATQDNIADLPIEVTMTDNGDGTYSHTFTVSQGYGTATVTVSVLTEGAVKAEYWQNTSWSGTPYITVLESNIDHGWQENIIDGAGVYDASGRWTGQIRPPTSETYTIAVYHDDHYYLDIGSLSMSHLSCCDWDYGNIAFTANSLYSLTLTWFDGGGPGYIHLYWSRPSDSTSVPIPASAYWLVQRLGNQVYNMEIAPLSFPNQCTIPTKPSSVVAGNTYTMTMQSRTSSGAVNNEANDSYTVQFVCQGGTCGSQTYTGSVAYQSSGLYQATVDPLIAGTYTVNVAMTNTYTATDNSISTSVSGTGFSVVVYPGQIDQTKCFTSLTGSPQTTSASAYSYTISFKDLWSNLHYQTLTDEISAGMVVSVTADYVNHDNYPSPIGIADLTDWQTTYGTSKTGSASDSNDGTMAASVTIQRAGTYTLTTTVDGTDVIGSPFSHLEVTPTSIDGTKSIAQSVPSEMMAGFSFSFKIQSRDQYSNNLVTNLSTAVGSNWSATMSRTTNIFDTYAASIVDDSSAGVYRVEYSLPKTQTAGTYDLNVELASGTVSTSQVTVIACTNANALSQSLVAAAGTTTSRGTVEYTIQASTSSVSLVNVAIYCTHTRSQTLESATVSLDGAAATSLDTTQLAGYGISIVQSDTTPTLSISHSDTTLRTATFAVTVKSTVTEETTWADYTSVTIDYINPSIPSASTIETYSTDHVAGTTYTVTMQSRNHAGSALTWNDDTYTVTLTQSDGNGSQTYTATAVHQSNGLYQAQLTPEIAAQYSLTVTMTNSYQVQTSSSTSLSNSLQTITIRPGQIDPTKCFTSLTGSPQTTSASAYSYTISFKDLWSNLHYQTLTDEISAGMVVSVTADYVNHDNYPSPIGIADLTDWQTTYGTSKTGSASDSNDGTMAASVTIQRAGTYTLTTTVDGTDVIGSPFSHLEVTPTSIDGTKSIAQSVPSEMMAGFSFSFKIQSRDQYSNNLVTNLSTAVGSNWSATMSRTTNIFDTYAASIVDDSSAGVYRVEYSLPKTQTAGTYDLNVELASGTVSTSQVTVIACTNANALSQSLVAAAGTTTDRGTVYYEIQASTSTVSLVNVAIYCTHSRTQTVQSATLTNHDSSTASLNESDLAGYGITINQSDSAPTLSIYYPGSNTLLSATFALTIKSTVTEETTWADYTQVIISYSNPSIPAQCTIESYPSDHEAGTTYTVTLQSRNTVGTALAWDNDSYTVTLTQSDGGGLQTYTATAVHQSNGLYQAQLTPELAAQYTLTATMTNSYQVSQSLSTTLSNSSQSVIVRPGQIDPTKSFTSLAGSPSTISATAYGYTISFKDLWSNLHYQTLTDEISAGMVVTVTADYVNHDNYPSPIGVADLTDWQTTYGTSISGSSSDNNDGTMAASVTIQRAGTYTLTTQIDGTDVIGSPFSSLEITPTSIDGTKSIAQSVPSEMMAGFSYSFKIQGRDQYSNNLVTNLWTAVGSNWSATMSRTSNIFTTYVASIVDDTSAGVYRVEYSLPKTQTTGTYDLNVQLSGDSVSTSQVTVIACTNANALSQSLLTAAGSTTDRGTVYYEIEASTSTVSLVNVEIYCPHSRTQTVQSATLTNHDSSTASLNESDLAGYGITINQSDSAPTLSIYYPGSNTLLSATFDLTIKSTVNEETTWADYTRVIVNYSNPSIPVKCTIESYPSDHVAGTTYTVTLQSRNTVGTALAWDNDSYTVTLTQSDGGGSVTYAATAVHQSNGLYQAQLTPEVAAQYTLTATMTNSYQVSQSLSTTLSNSSQSVIVRPGQIDPTKSFTSLAGSPSTISATAYGYTISFKDLWSNLHYQTLTDEISAGMVVTVTADYVNHDNYPSPIGVADLTDWQTTYGTSISGSSSDNNDGTMAASVTIQRAGTYTLTTQIDGTDVIGSPFSYLEVTPTSLDATKCIAQSVPSQMMAGFSYSFKIQGRDQYSNNLLTILSTAVGSNKSSTMSRTSNIFDTYAASIVDDTSAGVYRVEYSLPKTQTTGTYDLNVQLAGGTVSTPQVTVIACTNANALTLGLVAAAGTTTDRGTVYYEIEASTSTVSLVNVAIYCVHSRTQTVQTATLTNHDSSTASLNESELASYGITINQSDSAPTLSIYYPGTNTMLSGTFDLTIKSTVTEETTWADYTRVIVSYSNPSIPAQCTIESYPTDHEAGTTYTVTLQSRNTVGTALAWDNDSYTVTLTQSDGGGSQTYTATAVHQSNGLYQAQLTPLKAAQYTLTATMTNSYQVQQSLSTTLSNSPQTIIVRPGDVDPTKSYTSLTGSPTTQASVSYDFSRSFVDLWDNLHYQTLSDDIADGMTVSVTADYVNHDNYPSPLGVADLTDWQTTYGTSITGSSSDNNDGTMTGSVTILRAGTYTVSVKVDGVDVIGSPFSHLQVEPFTLNAPSCVAVAAPTQMYAGLVYSFKFQARDSYSNNLQKTISEAVGSDFSAQILHKTTAGASYTASLVDDSDAGVYRVDISLPTTQTIGDYSYAVSLLSQLVPIADVTVLACVNSLAEEAGFIQAPGGTTTHSLYYFVEDPQASVSLPLVTYYCVPHNPTYILTSATVSIEGAAAISLTESELNAYGITITSTNTELKVNAYSVDNTLGSFLTFVLNISATLTEETSWADFRVVTVDFANPSFPDQSTIESVDSTSQIAITPFTVMLQSRNRSGKVVYHDDDAYSVSLWRSDGGGSENYATSATHQGSGVYQAQVTPLISGQYTLTITLSNTYATAQGLSTTVSGSPVSVTVLPGAVYPPLCFTDVPASPTSSVNVAFTFTMSFRDQQSNLHYLTLTDDIAAGMVVSIVADYVNHDNYPSHIDIEDDPNWQSTYGVSISGSATDSNDGTMASSVTIQRAGTYSLTVLIDNTNVIGSPYQYLEIAPTTIHAPSCVDKDTPTVVTAGYSYSFLVQARDQYSNNLAKTLSQAVGSNHSFDLTRTSNVLDYFYGTVTDDTSAGVYKVDYSISKTQTAGTYDQTLTLNSLDVPLPQVEIEPCVNTVALARSLVAAPDTTYTLTTIDYTIEDTQQSVSLPKVAFYCVHDPIQIVVQATVTSADGTVTSLTEAQLANDYGISLSQSTSDPQLVVYSTDVSLRDLTFALRISSTVVQETTWSDYAEITINYYNPTIPAQSKVESAETTHIAITTYTMTMQSRNFVGSALAWDDDTYTVTLIRSDGGGSEVYTNTATHQASGLYQATLFPVIAGQYTMTVHLTNAHVQAEGLSTEISGSPFSVIILPGAVHPPLCFTDVPASPSSLANVAYTFTMSFRDEYSNLHFLTLTDDIAAGMVVSIVADYVNHDNYPSPIDVDDDPNWQSTYGVSISGSATDSNDGTMAATVTIQRAGTYSLTVLIDNIDVIGSPYEYLEIAPTTIHAPSCVSQDVQTIITAGYNYEFLIQARDQYSNNIQKSLSDALGSNHSLVPSLTSDSSQTFTGTISDYTSLGVYHAEMFVPKRQAVGTYDYNAILDGQTVPTPQVVIEQCTNTIAQALGWVTAPGTVYDKGSLFYIIGEAKQTVQLPGIDIYCEQQPIQLVASATVTLHDGSIVSLDETQLAAYGITIVQSDTDPLLEVYAIETSWITASFDLRISSTVVEETTWSNYATIVIDYSNPSVPSECTLETYDVEKDAGLDYVVTIQSRDIAGNILTHIDDTYSITLTRSDGGGSEVHSAIAIHVADGLYEATLSPTPTVAGTYSLAIELTNQYTTRTGAATTIQNSPFVVTILPGEIDPTACYTDLTGSPLTTAGVAYDFVISFVDLWGNEHYRTLTDEVDAGMQVIATAVYKTSSNYASPIDVPDLEGWSEIYGTRNLATLTDNDNGKMGATVTLFKAATYYMHITVNDVHVSGSPFEFLEVEPTVIDGSQCIPSDFPEIMFAGFDFSFELQGRDQYGNNISLLLADAVGEDFSTTLATFFGGRRLLGEGPTPQITDSEENPGVYQVDVTLPESIELGSYEMSLILSGQEVVTPLIDIQQCLNSFAFERSFLQPVGIIHIKDSVDYTIGTEPQFVQLHQVEHFCTNTPIQILAEAQVIFANGLQLTLTESQLESYGILIQQSDTNPRLMIYTNDVVIGSATFTLKVSTTVTEELTWEDFSLVKIHYSSDFVPFVPEIFLENEDEQIDASPRFDPSSTSSRTLQMGVDDNGNSILTQIQVDCKQSWSKLLPDIIDESPQSVKVSVTLGSASSFLSYNKAQSRLQMVKVTKRLDVFDYAITIQLKDVADNLASYTVPVQIKCDFEPEENLYVPPTEIVKVPKFTRTVTYEEQVFDENPPTPTIHSITDEGLVTIRFNSTMQQEAIKSSARRILASEEGKIVGQAKSKKENFERIHDSTIKLDGIELPSLEVSIEPAEPENTSKCSEQLGFSWEVVDFTAIELLLQLVFKWPSCVSSSTSEGDFLVINFNDQSLFKDSEGKQVWPQLSLKTRIKRQEAITETAKSSLGTFEDFTTYFILGVTIFTLVKSFITKKSAGLQRLTNAYKAVQILVFTLLIKVQLAAHTEQFASKILNTLAFRYFDFDQFAQYAFGTQRTEPLDVHFESMGFETSDSIINTSSLIFIAVIFATGANFYHLYMTYRPEDDSLRVYLADYRRKMSVLQGTHFLIDTCFLFLATCSAISIFEWWSTGQANFHSLAYSIAIGVIGSVFLISFASHRLCKRLARRNQISEKERDPEIQAVYKSREKAALTLHIVSIFRRVALAAVVTFGRLSFESQIAFVNFSTIGMLMLMGISRPFKSRGERCLELWNEFSVLLLLGQVVGQTDFVEDPDRRITIGWYIVWLLMLSVVTNFGYVLYNEGAEVYHRYKLERIKADVQEQLAEKTEPKRKRDFSHLRDNSPVVLVAWGETGKKSPRKNPMFSISEHGSESDSSLDSEEKKEPVVVDEGNGPGEPAEESHRPLFDEPGQKIMLKSVTVPDEPAKDKKLKKDGSAQLVSLLSMIGMAPDGSKLQEDKPLTSRTKKEEEDPVPILGIDDLLAGIEEIEDAFGMDDQDAIDKWDTKKKKTTMINTGAISHRSIGQGSVESTQNGNSRLHGAPETRLTVERVGEEQKVFTLAETQSLTSLVQGGDNIKVIKKTGKRRVKKDGENRNSNLRKRKSYINVHSNFTPLEPGPEATEFKFD